MPQVPQIASDEAARLLNESLAAAGVKRECITGWILHTGGRDVLLALRDKLGLSESDIRHSTAVLREFGNLSSPTVFFRARPRPARNRAGRVMVEVGIRRGLQLPWRLAGGGGRET